VKRLVMQPGHGVRCILSLTLAPELDPRRGLALLSPSPFIVPVMLATRRCPDIAFTTA
jgi:hypothetical protein